MKNREIKFRAWDKRTEKWIDNFRMFMHGNIEVYTSYANPQWQPYDQEHYELMQYTGLKDKNGKEIYEGDIVKIDDEEGSDYPEVFEISWMTDGACFFPTKNGKWNDNWDYNPFTKGTEDWEVIGNIYQNPELLSPNTKDNG